MFDFGRGGGIAKGKSYNMIVIRLRKELFKICKELSQNPNYKEFIGEVYKEFIEGLDTKTKYTN